MIGSNNIPLGIEVAVKNGVAAALEMERIAKSTKSVETAFAGLGGKIAGAFSVAAITSFVRSSLNYTSQFKDLSDQFAISASEAEGFSRQIRDVGGSSEKAASILSKLQSFQEQANDPRGLSEFINSLRQSYQATGDLGQIIEVVGAKNAPVFAAALREMSGGLEQFQNSAMNSAASISDIYLERFASKVDDVKVRVTQGAIVMAKAFEGAFNFVTTVGTFEEASAAFRKPFDEITESAQNAANSIDEVQRALTAARLEKLSSSTPLIDEYKKFQEQIKKSIEEYMQPSNFVGPLDPTRTNFYDIRDASKKEAKGLGALNFSASMAAGSSEAIVNYQKYRQGGAATVESEQLRTQRLIERYARETAENTRDNVQFDVIGGEITDLQ